MAIDATLTRELSSLSSNVHLWRHLWRLSRYSTAETISRAHEMAGSVDNQWSQMPENLRKQFVNFAYSTIGDIDGMRKDMSNPVTRLVLVLTGKKQSAMELLDAVTHLVDAVLNAVERGNENYQRALTAYIEESVHHAESSSDTTESELQRWLKSHAS